MKNDFSKAVLKVGQLWRDGHGRKVRIEGEGPNATFPFEGDNGHTYRANGGFLLNTRDKRDLVELIEDALPENIPTPDGYKRIDHEDGRIEFTPIEEEQEEYFDFGEKFYLNRISCPLFIGRRGATKGFENKELLVHPDYQVEVIEQDNDTRLRFKKKKP